MTEQSSGPEITVIAAGEAPPETRDEPAREPIEPLPQSIPSILLEGDEPNPVELKRPNHHNNHHAPNHANGKPIRRPTDHSLPEAYGTGRILLTARDPHSLYAHWDLTSEQQQVHLSRAGDPHLVLRVRSEKLESSPVTEIVAPPTTRHSFIKVPRSHATYIVELGYYGPDRKWHSISSSDSAMTPPETPSSDKRVWFARSAELAPSPLAVSNSNSEITNQIPESFPLADWSAISPDQPEVEKSIGPTAMNESVPAPSWSEAQEQALAQILPNPESLPNPTSILPEFGNDLSSQAAAQFGASLSSPSGVVPERKGFWFNVDAELIVYGATEPDAQLTLEGRPIQLRPDGTFSFRLAFPDGAHALRLVATSIRGELRQAELQFERSTDYQI